MLINSDSSILEMGHIEIEDSNIILEEDLIPLKKKKVIELILKVKGKTIKDNVKIPTNVDIALSNIDLVIQEVLNKPSVNVYA